MAHYGQHRNAHNRHEHRQGGDEGGGDRSLELAPPPLDHRIVDALKHIADVADPSPAIVVVCLTTHKWSPQSGSLL